MELELVIPMEMALNNFAALIQITEKWSRLVKYFMRHCKLYKFFTIETFNA